MDAWPKEQRKKNEVTMFNLGNHLVITPMINQMKKHIAIEEEAFDRLRHIILSSYVRGYSELDVECEKLSYKQIEAARKYMRLLDEKLIPTTTEEQIAFRSQLTAKPMEGDVNELLSILFTKTEESLRLSSELMSFFDLNPDRAVHRLKLIYALEHEDIDRLTYQVYRRLANFELPTDKLADLYYLVLIVSTLERIGDTLFSMAGFICNIYGFDREKLDYPLELLRNEVRKDDLVLPDSFLPLKRLYSQSMKEARQLLAEARPIVMERDGVLAYDYKKKVRDYRFRFEDDNFELTDPLKYKISDKDSSMMHLHTIRLGYRIRELLRYIESLGKRTCLFYYVEGYPELAFDDGNDR